MKAQIVNYRGSYKKQQTKQMIIHVDGVKDKAAAMGLKGKKVVWTTPSGKKIVGVIAQPHGNKGALRVHFKEKGLPGQALGTQAVVE